MYLCVLEVMSPQGPNFVLAADIPHGEADVFVFDCLYVKAWPGKVMRNNHTLLIVTRHVRSKFIPATGGDHRQVSATTQTYVIVPVHIPQSVGWTALNYVQDEL